MYIARIIFIHFMGREIFAASLKRNIGYYWLPTRGVFKRDQSICLLPRLHWPTSMHLKLQVQLRRLVLRDIAVSSSRRQRAGSQISGELPTERRRCAPVVFAEGEAWQIDFAPCLMS